MAKSKPRRRRYTRKKSRKRAKRTIPVAPILGLVAGLVGPVKAVISGNWEAGMEQAVENYTGYNIPSMSWSFNGLKRGLVPLLAGMIAHKAANALGVNRAFTNLPSPLDRLRI